MTWAVSQQCANAGQKLTLLMLANYCNSHTGQCNPSHKRLAFECCVGVSTLKNHLLALEESGLIEIVRRFADGVALPNQYVLNFEGGGSRIDGGVGQNLAEGGSESGRGVGQNLATNQELKPVIEPVGDAAQSAANKSRGSRLPQDWRLPKKWGEWSIQELVGWTAETVRQEADKFRDFWVSKAGKDAAKLDWEATWRNWCRNAKVSATTNAEADRQNRFKGGI